MKTTTLSELKELIREMDPRTSGFRDLEGLPRNRRSLPHTLPRELDSDVSLAGHAIDAIPDVLSNLGLSEDEVASSARNAGRVYNELISMRFSEDDAIQTMDSVWPGALD